MIKLDKLMPRLEYNGVSIVDITHRFSLDPELAELVTFYYNIQIDEHDSPESLALRVYGSQDYWWLILAINNVIDPFYDWLMSDNEIYEFCELTYGSEGMNDYHHYEDEGYNKFKEQSPEMDRTPITNLEWHMHVNDEKRTVDIINIKYLPQIENAMKSTFKNSKVQVQE